MQNSHSFRVKRVINPLPPSLLITERNVSEWQEFIFWQIYEFIISVLKSMSNPVIWLVPCSRDFRPNCTPLSSITIISQLLKFEWFKKQSLWILYRKQAVNQSIIKHIINVSLYSVSKLIVIYFTTLQADELPRRDGVDERKVVSIS